MDIKRLAKPDDPVETKAKGSTMIQFLNYLKENKLNAKITLDQKSTQMCICYEVAGKHYYYNISDAPYFDPAKCLKLTSKTGN